jgi:hypothetical protein
VRLDVWRPGTPAKPGQHVLVRSGLASEAEAERLARGTAGDAKVSLHRRS